MLTAKQPKRQNQYYKMLVFIVLFLFITFNSNKAQTNWIANWAVPGNIFSSWISYKPGKVSIDYNLPVPPNGMLPPTGIFAPNLLVHGFMETVTPPPNLFHNAVIRLQSGDVDVRPINAYHQSSLEFWSDYYSSPNQWHLGKIQTVNLSTVLGDGTLGNYIGGLALFSSGGNSLTTAQNVYLDANSNTQWGPTGQNWEGLRVVTGQLYTTGPFITLVGVGLHDNLVPRANLDILGKNPSTQPLTKVLVVGHEVTNGTPTEDFTVLSSGIVKIGSGSINTGSSYYDRCKLTVDGLILTTEILLSWDQWADYVFKDGYKLMPLDSVEKFLIDFKHLPGIPTEKEIQNEGVNVGQIQCKLLSKIEELTLYIIDMKKENEKLNKKVEELESKINDKK